MIQRWCVHTLKRHNDGPLAQSQSNFWKKMYSQWHKSSRQPSSNFSGDRFPAFAMSAARNRKTRRFERFQAGRFSQKPAADGHAVSAVQAAVWANCSHTPDCTVKLSDQGDSSLLGLHIVVQNYGQTPISLSPPSVCLRLKTGAACRPVCSSSTSSPTAAGAESAPAFLAIARDGRVCENAGGLSSQSHVVLNQWDFAVLGTCYFPLPLEVRFEPDALESCEELVVEVVRADSSGAPVPPSASPRNALPPAHTHTNADTELIVVSLTHTHPHTTAAATITTATTSTSTHANTHTSAAALELEHAQYASAEATEITGRQREIVAKFDEGRIWKHYTEVNSQFWVFSERPNLEVV